uniref:DUF4592 domain-containing protein n=1 Tax=Sphaeramia orbicularis TaxID=375764 RepID=A0A672ZYB4_9TELE
KHRQKFAVVIISRFFSVMFDILLCLFLPLHIPQRSKISLGSKALSHDSVFVSDSSEANEALGASQDSIHGKVKSLQLQLKQAIRLGSPPSLMCVKRTEDMGTMSEDDGLPCSPPEYTTHTALTGVSRCQRLTLNVTVSVKLCVPLSSQLSCAASSRAVSPLVVVPGDFSQPASPFACLDNSAAKHKLGLRHKACNKRKPANVRQTNTYTLQHPNTPAHTQLIQFTLLLLRSLEKDVEKTEAEEENSLHAKQTDNQMEEEGEEKKTEEKEEEEEEEEKEEEEEEEEEAKELEQEPEAKGEKLEKTVEDDKEDEVEVEEKTEEVEEPEEAKEDEKEDIQEKTFSEADGGEMVVDLEETADDVNAVNKDEMEYEKHGDQILPGQEEEDFVMMHESQKALDQMEPKEQNLDQEKDTAATEPNVEERTSEQDEEQESIQEFPQETKQEKEPSDVDTSVSSRPSSLTPPQTPTSPSKTSTIHINLVSPKAAKQSCDAATATNKEAKVSAPADETSKVRFTITPAWQRSLSIGDKDSSTLPSSSPAVGGTTVEEPLDKPESSSAKTELVLSPSRAKPVEMTTTKPQWNTSASPGKPQMEAKDGTFFFFLLAPYKSVQNLLWKRNHLKSAVNPSVFGVCFSDPSAARGGSDPPSWISVAKQKQKVYKENSLDNTAVHKVLYVVTHTWINDILFLFFFPPVSPLELNKSSASVEKESRSPTPAAQRGVPSPALTQDEPPWMALAKKKAKAWSEMPQIVQ